MNGHFPTQLVPIFDQGVQLWGEPLDGRVSYAFWVTNGAVDGTNVDNTDADDRKEFTGRAFPETAEDVGSTAVVGFGVWTCRLPRVVKWERPRRLD